MDTINERTSCTVTVSFFDEDDVAVTPTSATYRLDDVTSCASILAATVLTGLGTTKAIEINKDQNKIISEAHAYETRRLTIEFTYASTKHGTDEYLYRIKNLYGVATVSSASASVSASASAS